MYNQYPMGMPNYQIPQPMDRLGQLQQFQQQLQMPQQMYPQQIPQQTFTIGGKIVDSVEVVKATDVPMNGQMFYFPKADGSEIYGKYWRNDGRTEIVTYKPYIVPNDELANNDNKVATIVNAELVETFNARFDELASMIEKISKPTVKKKEVTDNE